MSSDAANALRDRLGRLSTVQRRTLRVRIDRQNSKAAAGGTARLIAYVVPRNAEDEPDVAELRDFLREHLPEVMVPSEFVMLEALPRLPNGKVDVRALPEPAAESRAQAQLVAPRTPAERALALIWAEVLGVDRIGVHDNFFELGGDSILSIQVVARAQRAGFLIAADQLFQQQTLAALAAAARPLKAAPEPVAKAERTRAGPAVSSPGKPDADAQFPESGLSQSEMERFLGGILP